MSLIKELYGAISYDVKRNFLVKHIAFKPTVINLLANDICNSKCQMCLIWQNKKQIEFSLDELETVLSSPLFSKVENVGITGGEPTLRADLNQIAEIICKKLPALKGFHIITNAISKKTVLERALELLQTAERFKKSYSVMVSLDGIGEIHDQIRGRKGNFESAEWVIESLKKAGVNVLTGTTITKGNVYEVDRILDYLIEKNIYGRFRVGEFIDRLYNQSQTDYIRNFDADETYHLMCFFHRLEKTFERGEKYRRTYRSIRNMLSGGKRLIGCPYQVEGIVFTSRNEALYCAPKSPAIGILTQLSPKKIFSTHLAKRREIRKRHCDDCIHDYHAPITTHELIDALKERFFNRFYNPKSRLVNFILPFLKILPTFNRNRVLITGWYGTETVGDKAILKSIISQLDPKMSIQVATMHPFVTKRTLQELGCSHVKLVSVYSWAYLFSALKSSITIFGGGPIMGIDALTIPEVAFRLSKREKVIWGCGFGPVGSNSHHLTCIERLFKLSTRVTLRDAESIQKVQTQNWNLNSIELIQDPSVLYISSISKQSLAEKRPYLACYLREIPYNYQSHQSVAEFTRFKQEVEKGIADYIKNICEKEQLIPAFYAMHTFHVGGDDRVYNRHFADTYFGDQEVILDLKPSSVDSIVHSMLAAERLLCMRFHSVVFAQTLNTRFEAIDYTSGGKIAAFMREKGISDRMISAKDFVRTE